MSISNINQVRQLNTFTNISGRTQTKNKSDNTILKEDLLEISEEGKKLLKDEEISVTSGKEKLNISKTKDGKSFNIHFEDSAAVLRAVDNGYISINGKKIMLSENDKKKLIETDKIAAAQRLETFEKRHIEHEMRVAKQQGAAWEIYFRQRAKIMESQLKLSKGEELDPSELKELLERDPHGYQMALMLKNMKENHKVKNIHRTKVYSKEDEYMKRLYETASKGVNESDIEWIGYNTSLSISLEGKEPKIGEISVGQRVIVEGKK